VKIATLLVNYKHLYVTVTKKLFGAATETTSALSRVSMQVNA